MSRDGVTAPIASATSIVQVKSLIRATQFVLNASEISLLDAASAPV